MPGYGIYRHIKQLLSLVINVYGNGHSKIIQEIPKQSTHLADVAQLQKKKKQLLARRMGNETWDCSYIPFHDRKSMIFRKNVHIMKLSAIWKMYIKHNLNAPRKVVLLITTSIIQNENRLLIDNNNSEGHQR